MYQYVVTTIHEQQTWEDMEDDFDEEYLKKKLQPSVNETSEIIHLCSESGSSSFVETSLR